MSTTPIKARIRDRIATELSQIEESEKVTVLYACESGSRAWGFESDDSDYDVRFIYLRRTHEYLTIGKRRDVIENPINDELDISGWDASKALELFLKSNPPLLEWLQSPILYKKASSFVERLRGLMQEYYSPISCMYHYLRMAENNYRKYLKGEEVRLKKYFYVLRPVLACLWIERGYGVVPIELRKLVDGIIKEWGLREEIDSLLKAKIEGGELDWGPRKQAISDFLERELGRLDARPQPAASTRGPAKLDQVFLETLIEVNGADIGSG